VKDTHWSAAGAVLLLAAAAILIIDLIGLMP